MEAHIEQHPIDFNRVSLIHFTASAWQARIKIPAEILRRIGNTAWVSGTKKLLAPEIVNPPIAIISNARTQIRHYAVPFPITGMNIIPHAHIPYLDELLTDLQQQFRDSVARIAANYYQAIQLAKEQLESDGLYDPNDYPRNIASKYAFEWRYLGINLPTVLETMNAHILQREHRKFIAMLDESREMTKHALMSQLRDLIEHAVERLTPGEDGKPKRFHDTLITNFQDFFNTFYARNLWQDDQMSSLVEEAKRILRNVSPDRLRESEGIRETISSNLTRLHQVLTDSVTSLPSRSLVLDRQERNAA